MAVSDPDVVEDQRFPLIGVVPVTGTPGEGALYPALQPGPSGLKKTSYALIDHIRSVDKRRVRRVLGRLPAVEMNAIDEGLAAFLGLRLAAGS
jgi:mRNA interferase MazF